MRAEADRQTSASDLARLLILGNISFMTRKNPFHT
jgi:hypothetical protein